MIFLPILFILVIKPQPGNFRRKITSIQNEMKAYELLDDKVQKSPIKGINKDKPLIIEPKFSEIKQKKFKKLKDIKQALQSDHKIYWNNGFQEEENKK
jgi:hypothetical protein